jgi:tetratricopeptide (TPR) repeat protein
LAANHSRRLSRLAAGAIAPALLLAVSAGTATAQPISDYNLDPLFQRLLARPSDLGNTLTYAAGIIRTDDIESAISTYEQLLFYNPNLSRVRYELGVLYYRLGSLAMARGYFQSAQEMRDVTPAMQQKAAEYVALIDKKLRPDQIEGFAQTGVRYQTNASAGPGPQAVLASGRTFDNRFRAQPDWNWFGAFGVSYSHDFGNQRGDTFEAALLGYDAQQFRLQQFDVGLLELRAGPRFGIVADNLSGASIKPYVVATGALLADRPYNAGVGGGVTAHVNVGKVALDPYVEVVQQSYRSSDLYPLASGLSGTLATYAMQAAAPIYGGLTWQARLSYAHLNADFNPYGYDRYSGDIWLPWRFALPGDARTWILTPSFGVSQWAYRAPDPAIDPNNAARNLEWRAGLGLDVQIQGQFGLALLAQYRAISSNIPVFTMQNWTFSVGPTVKF